MKNEVIFIFECNTFPQEQVCQEETTIMYYKHNTRNGGNPFHSIWVTQNILPNKQFSLLMYGANE